jgi:hypothetical protein
MFLQGWIIGWMIQLAVALVLWLPLALFTGGAGSWDRAWAIGGRVRTGFWLLLLLLIGGSLLVGQVQMSVPTGTNQRASTSSGGRSAASLENAAAPETMTVYDYTTISAPFWTPIIKGTVDEFNAVRPDSAPRLVYFAESGSFDCLDLPPRVTNLAGIIICDTSRPGEFPVDPNAPKEGWGGFERRIDDDTTRIVLNSYVPEGYFIPAEVIDNTICHEMMHAYTGVADNYDSDVNSCVFGDLLAPGTTDVRLMGERWLTTSEPRLPVIAPTATPERALVLEVPTVPTRFGCDPAYPESRTCIPPGPPFNQGCAITDEREFTVLPPDPQRLDRDKDGIGCEPVPAS